MSKFSLLAISPVDGRYGNKLQALTQYFSEFALIRYRIEVEIRYLIQFSSQIGEKLDVETITSLESIYKNFTPDEGERVKEIEKTTNHDVKAVEYFIKEKVKAIGLQLNTEWIHFGLTSQDINNTAIPLLMKRYENEYLLPELNALIQLLKGQAETWKAIPMLAKTHGQPASPTTLGKEMMVFVERLQAQVDMMQQIPFHAKFGGATGNFNAHKVSFPQIDWIAFGNHFVDSMGLKRSQYTTQIEHYDMLAARLDACKRINTILIDYARDIWSYISMDYFKQKIKAGEIGSSAMPHKVNPIDFENAEGNLGMANAILEHLSLKLPVSRLQRDLTDSTVLRNIGVPFAHTSIAIQSLMKGMDKLLLNQNKLEEDLQNNWIVIAEAIQTILRRENVENPYEKLKDLTRKNEKISKEHFDQFIDSLDITNELKEELKQITPFNYTGFGLL